MAYLTTLRVSAAALLLLGVACGDDDDDDDDDVIMFDAAMGAIDAPANGPDADTTPDAAPGTPDGAVVDGAVVDAAGVDAAGVDAGTPDAGGIDGGTSVCAAPVDLFPTPVTAATSPFPSIDDDILEVTFGLGFTFDFYGTTYNSVFLNTNGGLTFGAGNANFDVSAAGVPQPTIAPFWGDMSASSNGADVRADQMTYTDCDNKFIVTYIQFQDLDDGTWNNTGTLTLFPSGAFELAYGTVLSEDLLVGVFDGTHTADTAGTVAATIDYGSMGTGVILFDDFGAGPTHLGALNDQTINFTP